jgi:ACT domain-containing protein
MTDKTMAMEKKVDIFHNIINSRSAYYYKNKKQELIEPFLNSNYFTSATQKIIFKRMLKEIYEAMKNQSKLEMETSTYYAYEQLISGIKDLFPESWMLVRYFKYYSGSSEINQTNQMDVLNAVIAISKRDRSKFERLELENKAESFD